MMSVFRRVSTVVLLFSVGSASAEVPIEDEYKTNGFAIGCQAYTFKSFSVMEAIDKTKQAGGKVIEFYPGQQLSPDTPGMKFNHDADRGAWERVKRNLAEAKIRSVNYGVVGVPKNEAGARKVFEFAKYFNLRTITTESVESINTLEKMAKEYDICVAFHNHPRKPNDPNYKVWDPNYIAKLVEGRDRRVGACADTGHWVRSGLKPVECLRILKGRVMGMHLKDLNEFGKREAHDVIFGTGVSDVPGILEELKAQNFAGNISVEYEYNWDTNVEDVTKCIEFIRNYKAK
jgi:sugar phosphate isomerase/epimerase